MLATTSSSSNLSAYSTTSSSSSLNQEADSSGVGRSFDPRVVGYPYRLNLYAIPPPYELTVEEFEEFALDRLVVLKAIETAQLRNAFRAGSVAGGGGGGAASGASLATSASTGASNIVVLGPSSSINPALLKHIKDHLPLGRNALLKTGDYRVKELLQKQFHAERKKDHISHFILRLAFCSTPDLRRWFTKFEVELFKLRLEQEPDEQDVLMKMADLGGAIFSLSSLKSRTRPEEKLLYQTLLREFKQLYSLQDDDEALRMLFYQVPFEKVMDQVHSRNVIVKNGVAYVPQKLQTVLLVNAFKERLIQALESTAKALPRMDEDDRLIPILHSLAKQHISSAHNANGFMADGTEQRGFLHTDVDKLAKVHFAPCMRNLHTHLRQNAHLKHFGRLQYGLFLKAIGLPYEEALNFWRKAFHRMTDDQFTKGYLYNVRHSYGLEGKRTNYQAYNCMRIITTNAPSAGDHHGCPFKHFSLDNLKPMITDYLITGMQGAGASSTSTAVAAGVSEILNMTKQGHFQFACTRLFELTRGQALKATGKAGDVLENGAMSTGTASNNGTTTTLSDIIEHPNQYFELSFRGETDVVNSGKKIGSGGGGATGKLMMPSSSSSSSSSSSGLPILSQKSSSLSSQSQQPPSSQQDEQMIQELTQDMDFDDDLSDFDGGR